VRTIGGLLVSVPVAMAMAMAMYESTWPVFGGVKVNFPSPANWALTLLGAAKVTARVADAFCGLKRDGNIDVRIIRIHKRRGSPPDRLFVRTLISESARARLIHRRLLYTCAAITDPS
jgi:hypothetical protein